ncbi:MAG: ROK family protein [Steroidobacteraceae bacterium]
MTDPKPLFGGVELGGTKCICFVGTAHDDIRAQVSVPTGSEPETTLHRLVEQLSASQAVHGRIAALGIASFGPVDLATRSPTYGFITSTAKPGWQFVDVAGRLARAFDVPTRFDTDVNGAALAEGRWGAARELDDFAYVTVGTGVGVGLVVNGGLVHGFGHPELGHARVARLAGDDWAGTCALHGDCVEGLASGPAIAARAGMPADQVPADSQVWQPVAHALAQLLHTLVLATAPRRIILGGGVMQCRPELLTRVRVLLLQSLNGYLALDALVGPIEQYIVAPGLGSLAGPLGALALASDAYLLNTRAATG